MSLSLVLIDKTDKLLTAGFKIYFVDCTLSDINLIIPSSFLEEGNYFYIKRVDYSVNICYIMGENNELINLVNNITLGGLQSCQIISCGYKYWTL